MFTRPEALDDAAILVGLRVGWGFDAVAVDYLAAGFGSHHWVARAADGARCFVTVDDLASREFLGQGPSAAFDGLSKAFGVARALRDSGLNWVVGPLPGLDGRVLHRLSARYSIAVFPYVEGSTTEEYACDAERSAVVALLAKLHQSSGPVEAVARREAFRLPNRADLEAALRSVDECWAGGPYSERARALLRQHARGVRRILADYDHLAHEALRDPTGWTITHGEPHSANVLRTKEGFRIIDWDTALFAPRERDLWMLFPLTGADSLAQQYSDATGHVVDADSLRLYALWWDLCEIGIYLSEFRSAHRDTEDIRVAWRSLQHFVDADRRWPTG